MNKIAALFFAVLAATALLLPAPADEAKLIKPVNLAVNSKADEDNPFLSSSSLTLWYSSNSGGKFDILMSQRRNIRSDLGQRPSAR